MDSRYVTALRNSGALADAVGDVEPEHGAWSLTNYQLADVVDAIYAVLSSLGDGEPIEPVDRPSIGDGPKRATSQQIDELAAWRERLRPREAV